MAPAFLSPSSSWGTGLRASSFPFLWLPSKMLLPLPISWGPDCSVRRQPVLATEQGSAGSLRPPGLVSRPTDHLADCQLPQAALCCHTWRGVMSKTPEPHIPLFPPLCPKEKVPHLSQSLCTFSSDPSAPPPFLDPPHGLFQHLPRGCTCLFPASSC